MQKARMRAARFYGPGQALRLETAPVPRPAPGEALVRVRAAGVCHTELHLLDGTLNLGVTPLTPGHEVVGELVEARGATELIAGQRVLLYYYAPCGVCRYCRAGTENLCPDAARQLGFTADGGYAEYLVAPLRSLMPLPETLSDHAAVGLACGGATALHAARAVAQVQAGEVVVVYGVGGVGFYLVQLCRLLGARVLAIGRTPEKLARAAELGVAMTINARDDDPLAAVHQHTGGSGADVVFDLVASPETMAAAPRMLARQGRLIFAGYGADRFQLSPLWLVLREIQVRGAVGNTLAELRETVELAAAGRLRSVTGRSFALEQVNDALAALRAGELVGRGALVPLVPGARAERAVDGHPLRTPAAAAPLSTAPAPPTRPSAPRPARRPYEAELLELIAEGVDGKRDEAAFTALALGLHAYQYAHNTPYRQYCDYRGARPDQVGHWTEIPAVPIAAFKEATLATEPIEHAAALFMSSGTTRPEQRSRHYHPSLAVYDASARINFAAHVLPDRTRLPVLALNPPPAALPNSSLAHYLGLMVDAYGDPVSGFFLDAGGLHYQRLLEALREAAWSDRPVALLGATFAFVHLLDRMSQDGITLPLAAGSRAMDTGGVKGRSREIARDELAAALEERLGIPASRQINMYGLTELSTQFLDATLRRPHAPRHKAVPPWARTRVLDPETLRELPAGTPGVLCHTDLANRASVCTVLTEDLGVALEDGFEIMGRVAGSQARGCSIALDELLAATRGHA